MKIQTVKDILRTIILLGFWSFIIWGITMVKGWPTLLMIMGVMIGGIAITVFLIWVFEDEPKGIQ